MSTKPTKVELFEEGKLKLELTDSDEGSLNGRENSSGEKYKGQATSVKIFGSKGSGVTFYDNKGFRPNENHVYIEKLTDEQIEVFISKNFVPTTEEMGDAVFFGEEAGKYKWIFYKHVKGSADWQTAFDIILGATKVINLVSPTGAIGSILGKIISDETKSNNYRVDNCSSIKFGDPPIA